MVVLIVMVIKSISIYWLVWRQ